MSMFDNLMLDEFTMLDEGKQAEEYEKRKRREASNERMNSYNKAARRDDRKNAKDKGGFMYNNKAKRDQIKQIANTSPKYRENQKDVEDDAHNNNARDNIAAHQAIDRHLRRHPKTESALMLIAGYDSEYAY